MRVLAKFKKPKATRILGGALGLLLALTLVLMPVPVLAVPQMPHQFYGTVTIGGDLDLEGTIVSAQIGGKEYASTTVDAQGRYGYSPDYGGTGIFKVPADDPGTPEKEGGVAGETVDFYVFNTLAGQYEFEIWGITQLDLTVAEAEPVTVNVIVEGQTSTIWRSGEVTFQTSTITDKEGDTYTIGHPTALGALDEAAKAGDFTYVVSSEWCPLGFVEEIAGDVGAGMIGWLYTVNWVNPGVAAVDCDLKNGDVVLWYYGTWGEIYVVTNAASAVTRTSATLNGNLGNLGTALSVDVSFEWGRTTDYDRGETTAQTMTSTGSFTATLSGLSDDTTYHFRARAVGDGTSYGADRSFTTRRAAGGGGGGGGGGGEPPAGTTDVGGKVSTAGVFQEQVTALSEDELCTLTIPEDTVGLTEELEPLDEITILIIDEPPAPPEDAHVIGLAYDFGPDGATFDPPITLTFNYDPSDVPEGIAEEDLVLAYYDEDAGEWVELEGCVVDPVNNTITASVSHFTAFAITGTVPPLSAPAAFSLSGLKVSPAEVETGSPVTISTLVENTGGQTGIYEVTLKIDGAVGAIKEVTLDVGASEKVTFTTSRDVAGSYSVDINGLTGSFTVTEPAVPTLPPEEAPPPAKPISWPVIGGTIAGIIIVGLLIFFLVRRRAY